MVDSVPPDLTAVLTTKSGRLGAFSRVTYRDELESTNDLALSMAMDGEPEGTVVIADHQRAGRGRRGRDWFSPPGAGVYLSAIVRPRGSAGSAPILTLAAGVAAATAVQTITALPLELKWPNDLVIGRPWRKLGGVLCETAGQGSRIEAVVVGIGVNLLETAYPREIAGRATSIEAELGRGIERAPIVAAMLEALASEVDHFHAGRLGAICAGWRAFAASTLGGASVRWTDRTGERHGRARDIDGDGALLVECGGRLERLVAGEVSWEGLSRA
jgi:BirA family transcriptional regulator, biotin operon repressor / biotin---[acetyl-CoA-carboxylase] ligase